MIYGLSDDTWGREELKAVHNVIDSRLFSIGKNVRQFEEEFARYFGAKHAVMSNSGSSANLLMAAALIYSGRLHPGDEVLVTAVSWSTTYFPLAQMGLKLRFADIDINTLNADSEILEQALTKDTKAVMAVNLLGNPNDYARICQICRKHNLVLLEDNCESMGAQFQGRMAGTFGLISSFSTYFSHHLCTMEGGMNLTDDEELYHYMLSIRSHGWTRHLPENSPIYTKTGDSFYESFHFILPGFNVRPLEIEAAAGIEQLKKLDGFVRQRRENAAYFMEKIGGLGFQLQTETGSSSWFGFAVILPEDEAGNRRKYIRAMETAGIETRPIAAGNFVRQKALQYMDYSIYGELKHADYIHENGFFTGNHSSCMREQIDYLASVLKRSRSSGDA